jgi:heavy metal sensor kinase
MLILLLFSLMTYWGMQRVLFQAMDKELDVVASVIERSYDPFFKQFQELDIFHENVNRFLEYYLIVFDGNGQYIYASPLTNLIELDVPLSRNTSETGYTLTTKVSQPISFLNSSSEGKTTFRVINRQLMYHDQRVGWITIGLSIGRVERSMKSLLEVILGTIFISVILSAVGSYFLTRKALYPVNMIIRKANQISRDSLDERISVPVEKDELGQLTNVLNNLLDRLQQSFLSQQQFMSDAAHELKTPLTVLRSHWENELNNPDLGNDIKERLVQDIETITRLSHLINNLLMLAQTEEIRSRFEFKPVRLDELLNDVLPDVKILAEIKSQKLEIIGIQTVSVSADRLRLYQLLFNVLDNAVKYTPENGIIWINLRTNQEYAIIEIRDNGIGISPEDLPHIFKRFYRVQKDRARKTGGSGLGLAICRMIAQSHQGDIEVESHPGHGSTFTIKIPALSPDPAYGDKED